MQEVSELFGATRISSIVLTEILLPKVYINTLLHEERGGRVKALLSAPVLSGSFPATCW
jgi:hypothetical protein